MYKKQDSPAPDTQCSAISKESQLEKFAETRTNRQNHKFTETTTATTTPRARGPMNWKRTMLLSNRVFTFDSNAVASSEQRAYWTSAEELSNWRIEHVDVILGGSPCKIVQGGSHTPLPRR